MLRWVWEPLPWTAEALTAAQDITDESEELTADQKLALKATFPYLTTESPRSPVEANRFKNLIAKLAPAAKELIQKTLDTVITEGAKRIISGL